MKIVLSNFIRKSASWVLEYIDIFSNYFNKYLRDSWFYDQQIPIQSILRTRLEYSTQRYNTHEIYNPDIEANHPSQKTRQLRLAYDPQIIPQPYYFHLENAVTFRKEVIDPQKPKRLVLENYPETTEIEEGRNYSFSLRDRTRAKLFNSRANTCDYNLGYAFTGPWVNNYYHFIIDYCLKYNELSRNGVIDERYNIIYHNKMRKWQLEYYGFLGIDENRLVGSRDTPLHVNKLLIGSSQRHRFAVSNLAIQGFKNTIFSRLDFDVNKPNKRFYLSRRNARVRRILNEDEVVSFLKFHGFQIIQPETLSLTDQIKLFAEAEVIVAPHGAGLTNIIFSKLPKIVELIPGDDFKFGYFIGLTNSIGGQHFPLICAPENSRQDFVVPIQHLDELLMKL